MLKFTFLKEEHNMSTFEDCIDKVLEHEGGYVNDPKDLGGETNFGISKRAYPNVDIKELTRDDAKAIYKKDYWNRYKIEKMPSRLRYIYFDMVLNMGSGNAAKVVQMQKNILLNQSVMSCDIINADGISIVWAARFLGYKMPKRVTGIVFSPFKT